MWCMPHAQASSECNRYQHARYTAIDVSYLIHIDRRLRQAHPKATTRVVWSRTPLSSRPCSLPCLPWAPCSRLPFATPANAQHPLAMPCRLQDAGRIAAPWALDVHFLPAAENELLKHWHPAQNVVLTGPGSVDVKPHACFVSVSRRPVGFGTRGCLSLDPLFPSRETNESCKCTGSDKDRTQYRDRRRASPATTGDRVAQHTVQQRR
jgi:hypothetical protein